MGRQWLHAKREVAGLKKGRPRAKLSAKSSPPNWADRTRRATRGWPPPEKARKQSVTRDAIERAIKKGAGIGDDKLVMEHVVFEGYAPHKVPVIVEVLTDNVNRTAPELRVLFKKGQLGAREATNSFSITSAWSRRTTRT